MNYINTCDDVEFVIDEHDETLGNEIRGYLEQLAEDEFEVVEDPRTPKLDMKDGGTPTVEGFGSDGDEYQNQYGNQNEYNDQDTYEVEAETSVSNKGEY